MLNSHAKNKTQLYSSDCVYGGWYIPIQSSSVVDPGGDDLPSVQFVQEIALARLHVPIVHWRHTESVL